MFNNTPIDFHCARKVSKQRNTSLMSSVVSLGTAVAGENGREGSRGDCEPELFVLALAAKGNARGGGWSTSAGEGLGVSSSAVSV